jgi:hypothetical protein
LPDQDDDAQHAVALVRMFGAAGDRESSWVIAKKGAT